MTGEGEEKGKISYFRLEKREGRIPVFSPNSSFLFFHRVKMIFIVVRREKCFKKIKIV